MEFTIYLPIVVFITLLLILLNRVKVIIMSLVFSLTLQVTSVINILDINYSLQIYRFLSIVLSFLFLLYIINNRFRFKKLNGTEARILIYGFLFSLYSINSSMILPLIFEGIEVFPPQLGIDYSAIYGGSPLKFSIYNLAFSLFLIFYYLSLVLIIYIPKWTEGEALATIKLFLLSFYLNFIVCLSQLTSGLFGTPDITKFLYTIITRKYELSFIPILNIPRIQGTYQEPSMFAPFIVGIYSYYLSKLITDIGLKNLLLTILSLLLVAISASTAAIISLVIITGVIVVYHTINSKKKSLYILSLFTSVLLVFSFTSVLIAFLDKIYFSGFISNILDFTILGKLETYSFQNRFASDVHSIKIIIETNFLGVGMGSHRSSSLLTNMLSQVGIIGTLLFIFFSYYIIKNSLVLKNTKFQHIIFFYPSVLISQLIAYPDITSPTLWQAIYINMIASSCILRGKSSAVSKV